jgi:hypothetical protein
MLTQVGAKHRRQRHRPGTRPRLRLQAQHKRAARDTLEHAVGIFERLGARLWLE